jgi:Fe-S oxidoreductase
MRNKLDVVFRLNTGKSLTTLHAHCTVCHKCLTPCPVKIDFGDVTMNMRNLLRKMGQKKFNPDRSTRQCSF